MKEIAVIIFPNLKLALDTYKIIRKAHPEWQYSGRSLTNVLSQISGINIMFSCKKDNYTNYNVKAKYIYKENKDDVNSIHEVILKWMNEGFK